MKQDIEKVTRFKVVVAVLLLVFTALLASCQNGDSATPSQENTQTVIAILPTFTPFVTSVPLAASVNGAGITLPEYQAELLRYQDAMVLSEGAPTPNAGGTPVAANTPPTASTPLAANTPPLATNAVFIPSEANKKRVLDDLINQLLLAQAAVEQHPLSPDSLASGLMWDKTVVEERLARLIEQRGGTQAFQDWLTAYHYTEIDFKTTLSRAIAAAWMRDQIIAGVPKSGEQIHARQILVYNESEAKNVLARLQAGEKFEDLAAEYDPVGLGELGWFPKGYLLEPEFEAAVFALQPEQYSQAVQTRLGYHIIQVLEREQQRVFAPDALLTLQMKAVQDWLTARRNQGEVKILIP